MEILGFAAVAATLIGGAVLLSWLIGRSGRNTDDTHGGGSNGASGYY